MTKEGFSLTAEEVANGVDASGLVAIVTGGASGIGIETVRVLASRGAHVILAARKLKEANAVKESVEKQHANAKVEVMQLDLASLASVRSFAQAFLDKNLGLNILVNNAGVMFLQGKEIGYTQDGIELQFGTNHIGHFLLVDLLLDNMKKTSLSTGIEGRIVNLSSVAHRDPYKCGIKANLEEINDSKSYDAKKAYGQSKLANILHATKLTKKLKAEGAGVTINAVHPGIIMTALWRNSDNWIIRTFVRMFYKHKTVPQGAATTIYVALSDKVKGVSGKYFEDCGESEIKLPKIKGVEDVMTALEDRLWELSESIVSKLSTIPTVSTNAETSEI